MIRLAVALLLALVPLRAAVALPLVTPQPLLIYTEDVLDYRPAINGAGTRIVFERQFFDPATKAYGPVNLFILEIGGATPKRLVTDLSPTTRPDWCRYPGRPNVDGQIAYTQGNVGPIHIAAPTPGPANAPVPATANDIYPTWFPGCGQLAVDFITGLPESTGTGPTTLKISPKTGAVERHLTGSSLWAGFPSVNPASSPVVVFAGQQFKLNATTQPCTDGGYQQDCNYIYIGVNIGAGTQVLPLDPDTPTNRYDPQQQGRAPSFSPDGRWIAFESNRACSDKGFYAIFMADFKHQVPTRQVTDCAYNAQHAKWYLRRSAGRTRLVVSVLRNPCSTTPNSSFPQCPATREPKVALARVIASLDVTAFLK